jgi:hypothetical protein
MNDLQSTQRVRTAVVLLALACRLTLVGAVEVKPIHKLAGAELEARLPGDARAVLVQRDGLRAVISFIETRPDIFPIERPKASRLLRREEKEVVWSTWQRFLDYVVALDSVERYHAPFYRLKVAAKEDSFLIGYAAMLSKYRAAMEFIERCERNPELDKVLNDSVPELGLPAGTYAKLKFKHLNVAIASDFAAREVLMMTVSGERQPQLRQGIQLDAEYLRRIGKRVADGEACIEGDAARRAIRVAADPGRCVRVDGRHQGLSSGPLADFAGADPAAPAEASAR